MLNLKRKNIKLLDCTLRDGGYYNNWNFSKTFIKKYLLEIEKANIRNIEIGFRFFKQKKKLGSLGYSKDSFLKKLNIPKKINICVMVNSEDLLNKTNNKKDHIFNIKNKSRIDTIRFATHFRDINNIIPYLKEVKKLGYKVMLNLMQCNDRSENELKLAAKKLSKANCISVLYFADSLGKMKPSDISNLFKIVKKYWKKDLGLHSHDNKGMALANCIEAIKNDVKWIDATVLGMGRGAGNIQTEIFLTEILSLKNDNFKLEPIYRLSDGPFAVLKKKYNWGMSLNYYLAANYNIHPTYIQTLENDPKYSKEKTFKAINYLKNIDTRSFNKAKLKKFLKTDKI